MGYMEDSHTHDQDASGGGDTLETLNEKLKICEAERSEYLEGWQRSKADYANFKRETLERERDLGTRLKAKLVRDLLPVLESMTHAKQWIKDLGPIETQLEKVLADYGLASFGKVGETFDPSLHESIELVEVDSLDKDNIIVDVLGEG